MLASDLKDGEILLLENVRFHPGETSKDDRERDEFARCLEFLTGGEDDGGAFVRTRSARCTASTPPCTTSPQLLPSLLR